MTERIYSAWNKKKVASALLLDVTGAFDNVLKDRLLHNLRQKRIDSRIVNWIQSFLTDRSTVLRINEHTTSKINYLQVSPQDLRCHQYCIFFTIRLY